MEQIFSFLSLHPFLVFFAVPSLFFLAGCFFPINDELLIISCGVASQWFTLKAQIFFLILVFLSALLLGDTIPYLMGRFLFHRSKRVTLFIHRRKKIVDSLLSRGGIEIIIGRYIPFGVRNLIMAAAGVAKISFWKFLLIDMIGVSLSCVLWFSLLHYGFHAQSLLVAIKTFSWGLLYVFIIALILILWYKKARMQK